MRKLVLLFLLLTAGRGWAADKIPASDYNVTVQVTGSRFTDQSPGYLQCLYVIVDGTKYVLGGSAGYGLSLLKPGTYKARVIQDRHKTDFEIGFSYELLLPDDSRRKFAVIGMGDVPESKP